MFNIEDGILSLTKGDTAYLSVKCTVNQEEFTGDGTVVLSVKKNVEDENYTFQKEVAYGEAIVIDPQDTKKCEVGKYVYDIQLLTDKGEVFTIVQKNTFKILQEVGV